MASGIEMEIPKDIRKYEAKLIGPLTLRQLICGVPAAAIAVITFTTLIKYIPEDLCIILVMLTVSPLILCGWVKIYDMPFEKFAKTVIVSSILSPRRRKYKTVNVYELLTQPAMELENKTAKNKAEKRKKKKSGYANDKELVAYK